MDILLYAAAARFAFLVNLFLHVFGVSHENDVKIAEFKQEVDQYFYQKFTPKVGSKSSPNTVVTLKIHFHLGRLEVF